MISPLALIFIPKRVHFVLFILDLYTKRYNMQEQLIALSEFVRQKRKSLRITQKEMSEKSGVGIRFIRELERGKETLKMDKVNQVLDLFGFELGPIESTKINRNNEES
jgi:y4mF family transcriptional regulator